MFKKHLHIFCILLLALSVTSCMKDHYSMLAGEGTIIISGVISDKETGMPLKDIKVVYEACSPKGSLIVTKTAYTSDQGIYTIESEGYTTEVNCTVTAEGAEKGYSQSMTDLHIDWSGSTFSVEKNTFYVNDCNFYLQKNVSK